MQLNEVRNRKYHNEKNYFLEMLECFSASHIFLAVDIVYLYKVHDWRCDGYNGKELNKMCSCASCLPAVQSVVKNTLWW